MSYPVPPPSSLPGRIPDFIIIGGQKCGTSALYRYLECHPEVAVSREKELNFFLDAGVLPPDSRGFERGAWHLGVDWYRRWFATDKAICGEASPNYTLGPGVDEIARRIAAVAPGARLVYLVRHPLERARSAYLMELKRVGARPCSFSDFIVTSNALAASSYGTMLEAYLRHVPQEQILVLESASLDAHRREALAAVFRFLGIDDRFWCDRYAGRVFVGSRRPFVSPSGAWVRGSLAMNYLRRRMPESFFYHVENMLLRPFRVAEPSLALPADQAAEVVARLRSEMERLRELTGATLPSLEVSIEQATAAGPAGESPDAEQT